MEKGSRSKAARSKVSSRRGGPSTFHGTEYQLRVILLELLQRLPDHLVADNEVLTLEPRIVSGKEQFGFDFAVPNSRLQVEVKLAPTRADVMDWLEQVRRVSGNAGRSFRLVHARGGQAIGDLEEIVRLAREAYSENTFAELISIAATQKQRDLAAILTKDLVGTSDAWTCALQIDVQHQPEDCVERDAVFLAKHLFPGNHDLAIDRLLAQLRRACIERASVTLLALTDDLKRHNIRLRLPPLTRIKDLDVAEVEALALLSKLPDPLPESALLRASQSNPSIFTRLEPFIERRDGLVKALPIGREFAIETIGHKFSTALRELVSMTATKSQNLAFQVRNLLSLCEICIDAEPELVASAFPAFDKLVKTTGDFHIVLRLARLSVTAANKLHGRARGVNREVLLHKARTLVCGFAWVYQRVDKIARAREHAEESHQIGMDINSSTNTAFSKKCLGRLYRLEAESAGLAGKRKELLLSSETYLLQAAELFEKHPDFGPASEDFGECHSLLARTMLVSGRIVRAREALNHAYRVLEKFEGSKSWADSLLLDGEIHFHGGDPAPLAQRAESVIRAVQTSEASETIARAWRVKSRALAHMNNPTEAEAALQHAIAEYERLRDSANVARARWELHELRNRRGQDSIPRALQTQLERETNVAVRVASLDVYTERLSSEIGVIARRGSLTARKAEEILEAGRLRARVSEVDWE